MAPKLIPSILVCVTSQTSCERLIRAGSKLLEDSQQLRVLSIQPRSQANGNPDALEHLFSVSTDVGAEMAVYYSDNPVDTAKMYINRHPIVKIVVGAAPGGGASLFISSLRQAFPGIPILVVTGDSRLIQISSEGITL